MEKFDVIVVGGSVAGAPVATWLARSGHRVLVLDRARFPRDTNSTHFIWPRGMSYLNRLGVAKKLLERTPSFTHLEINIEGISLRGCVPLNALRQRFLQLHGNDDGVVQYYTGPRRYFLDTVLLDEARASGVDVREQTTVKAVILNGERVCGVRAITASGAVVEAYASIVIGADGRMSHFADMVGSRKTAVSEKSTFAYYGYYSGVQKEELVIHKRGRFGTAIFPTMDDRHLVLVYGPTAWWGDFSADAEANFIKTYEFVAPDVAALVRRGSRVEPFKAMGRMVAFHRENWGPGWTLIGDACSFKDQWTAMGITHSLRDAELISVYIDRVLTGKTDWEKAMAEYSHVRMRDYEQYWNFVCDGAECSPYTADQLKHFHELSHNPKYVDQFMARMGDTVSFSEAIEVQPSRVDELPIFIRNYDIDRLGYQCNLFAEKSEAPMI